MKREIKKVVVRHVGSGAVARETSLLSAKEQELNDIEEGGDRSILAAIVQQSAINAVNKNKALGIPITFLQDDWVVRRMPDGTIERIKQVSPTAGKIAGTQFKKGTVLHVKRTR